MPNGLIRALLVVSAFGAMTALSSGSTRASDAVATGCLSPSGKISRIAVGDEPARPCNRRETEISLQLSDNDETQAQRVDFFIVLDGDRSEETIATNGPLELFARCFGAVGNDILEIVVTSTVDGWWISAARNAPVGAGAEEPMFSLSLNDGTTRYAKGSDTGTTRSAVAPDGSYIGVEPDTLGLGLNILGHDCIAVGTATLMTGALD